MDKSSGNKDGTAGAVFFRLKNDKDTSRSLLLTIFHLRGGQTKAWGERCLSLTLLFVVCRLYFVVCRIYGGRSLMAKARACGACDGGSIPLDHPKQNTLFGFCLIREIENQAWKRLKRRWAVDH